MSTHQLHQAIEPYLERIEQLLPPDYKLTLVARYCGEKYGDADIVLTVDSLQEAERAIRRRIEAMPPTFIACDRCGEPAVVNVQTFNYCEDHKP